MRLCARLILIVPVFTTGLVAQNGLKAAEEPPPPVISSDQLSADQISIYRTVLAMYSKHFQGWINLADTTEALEASGKDLTSCIRNPEQKAAGAQAPIVHRLPRSLVSDLRFVLVDPNVQAEEVKQNDPGNVIGGGATDAQIGKAVDEAFRTGLFALSEIAFDTTHQRAVVSYSFWCGRLCGHGALLRLNKDGSKWKIAKRCADWIS